MSWTVPKLWNSPVWIIGGGISLKAQCGLPITASENVVVSRINEVIGERLRGKRVIGLNKAFLLGDWIDVLYFGDVRFLDWFMSDLVKFKNIIATCACFSEKDRKEKLKNVRIKYIQRDVYPGVDTSRPRNLITWFGNTGASAIHLAVLLGATKIYLLGYDGTFNNQNIRDNNWHSPYPEGYARDKAGAEKTYSSYRNSFEKIARDLTKIGIDVINCTPNTAIEYFKLGNFDEEILKC